VLERAHGEHQERDEVATPERGRISPPGLAANVPNTDVSDRTDFTKSAGSVQGNLLLMPSQGFERISARCL